MPFRNNGHKRDVKKLICSIVLLIIGIAFFFSIYYSGFSITKLGFALFATYFSSAFFRISNE